jgi:hypothetical protein
MAGAGDPVPEIEGAGSDRRDFMRRLALGVGTAGLAPFVAHLNEALAADGDVPADKSEAGYTLTAA